MAIYKFIEWVATIHVMYWLIISLLLVVMLIRKRYTKRQNEKNELEVQRARLERLGNLSVLQKMTSIEFEKYICDLFIQLGYEASVTQASGDRGKDIVMYKENAFTIAECKRYVTSTVGRPHIQKFHSAVIDSNAEKGYFITTGEFTKQAVEYIVDKPIELINGEKLVVLIEQITRHSNEPVNNIEFYLKTIEI